MTAQNQVQHTHAVTTNIKQEASRLSQGFQECVVDPAEKKEEWAIEELKGRYEWGRRVNKALERSEYGDSLAKEIGRLRDRTPEWVRQHARFARRVDDAFQGFDPSITGYIAQCQDLDRSFSWNSARKWSQAYSDKNEGEGDDKSSGATVQVDEQMRKVERLGASLEEETERLLTLAESHSGQISKQREEQLHGVITRVAEVLQEGLPEVEHFFQTEPIESEAWRKHIHEGECIIQNQDCQGQVMPHHPKRRGTAQKESDLIVVRLCDFHHREVEDMPEQEFWEKYGVNPWEHAAFTEARFLEKVLSYEGVTT